ncbi:MAG: hypothetical protein NVV62_07600 [Terricaulis sp.]|nr:hypothetical protein [Terricaulis sp.]
MTIDYNAISAWFSLWGLRILAAAAILIAAHFAAKAVKWGIAKGIDRIPSSRAAMARAAPVQNLLLMWVNALAR